MARQIIFHKYQGTENGFLIYDIRKNGGEMNDGLLHMIRSRNFGLDLDGILVGPYLVDGSLEMKMFDRQGHEVSMKKESTDVPKQVISRENVRRRSRDRKRYTAGVKARQ